MNTFNLLVSTEKKILFRGQVRQIGFYSTTGARVLEPRHESYVGLLATGKKIEWKTPDGKESELLVKNGMLTFKKNSCSVVCTIVE